MRSAMTVWVVLGWALTSAAFAGYTVDGSLSDWGVTPFVDWIPNPPADFTETNNVNFYHAAAYSESYDFEAMYFDNDAGQLYLGVVSSHPLVPLEGAGDIGIDLNGDMTVSEHGVVTGLEYALLVGADHVGQVRHDPVWSLTTAKEWPDGWQGSPFRALGGTVVGEGTVAVAHYPNLEFGTYILEAAVPWDIVGGYGQAWFVGLHMSNWCGNDSINLHGSVTGPPVVIPAPGALVLVGLGASLVGWWRRGRGPISGR
ncbi:MAG: hypothetical protein MUC88_07840 [Planctomycetes bacterium]|nr:hypothetical protein [Planctomycetota bacterium]